MTNLKLGAVLQHLRRAAARKQEEELSDGQLLERFVQRRDDSAFAALLRRHGPMVLGVCRGVLRRMHDVEDAFQATFLILAQKAGRIRRGDSVGGWLHEVAYNVALKAQASAKQAAVGQAFQPDERTLSNRTTADPLDELTVRELRQALHEELQRLPEQYRTPLILCYLEGKTQEEAARQLGWPSRRVKYRLQQGRERLRRRLQKRGLAPAVALGTALFAADGVSTAVPAVLAATTLRSVAQAASLAPAVAALVEASSALVSTSKVKGVMVLLLAVSLLAGAAVRWNGDFKTLSGGRQPPERGETQGANAPRSVKHDAAKTLEIQGRVLGIDGKPKAGAKLILLDQKGRTQKLGITAADGRFTVVVPKEFAANWEHWLIAQADGAGIRFRNLYHWKAEKPVELRLVKDHIIRGRVVTTEGKPVASVRVAAEEIESFANDSLDNFLAAWKNGQFDRPDQNIWSGAGSLIATTTDAEGRFALAGIGCERTVNLRLSGGGIAATSVRVVNRAGFDPKPYNQAFLDRIKGLVRHGNWRWWMLAGPDVSVVAQQEKVIRGTVRDADTGKGVPGIVVRLPVDSDEAVQFPPEAQTDAQGYYEMHGVRKTKRYLLAAAGEAIRGYVNSQVWADDTTAYQAITANLRVKKGVIITGKVIDGGTGKPIRGFAWPAVLDGNPFVKDYPTFRESFGLSSNLADSDGSGTFRVVTIPGPIVLMGGPSDNPSPVYKPPQPDSKYPQYFSVEDPRHRMNFRINVHPDIGGANGGIPQGNFCKVLEIKPGVTMVKQDIVLERATVRTVTVQDAEGRPLAGTWAAGIAPRSFQPARRISEASCSVYGERNEPKLLVFYHPDKKLAGTRRLQADEKEPIAVRLGPAGAIKGRLLDGEGKPRVGVTVEVNYRDREAEEVHRVSQKPIVTDANGAFTFDDVLPELKFELSFRHGAQRFERESKPAEATMTIQPGQRRDLGSISLKRVSENPGE